MPELPEVETIKKDLEKKIIGKKIIGKKIKDVEIKDAKQINVSVKKFKKLIIGKNIRQVNRRAKVIIMRLNTDNNLMVHLKMTGQLLLKLKQGRVLGGGHSIENVSSLPNKFTRIIFTFDDDSVLYFNDVRKFGWIRYYSNDELISELDKYGLEPLDRGFTLSKFIQILNQYPKKKSSKF